MRRCITDALANDCAPAEYEWAYTGTDMLYNGKLGWIPLCEDCCAYWRSQPNLKPYRVRSIRNDAKVGNDV